MYWIESLLLIGGEFIVRTDSEDGKGGERRRSEWDGVLDIGVEKI